MTSETRQKYCEKRGGWRRDGTRWNMFTYNQDRISTINDPWIRLACAVIMQAVLDYRVPGSKLEINRFFHGPLVGNCGIDGDLLLYMAEKVTKEI